MKRNAIVRIIIFSIAIFILLGILLSGLAFGMLMMNIRTDSQTYYELPENSQVDLDPNEIQNINIEWASGTIDVRAEETNTITFSESGTYTDDLQMVWKVKNDTLIISFSKPTVQIGFSSYSNKDLTVTVPKSWICNELSLEVASADVTITDLQAEQVDIDTASGDYEFINCTLNALDVDTASGSIYYTGNLNTLDCDAASGSFEGKFISAPTRIEMDSASGDLDLTLPTGCGFRVTMDALSSKFHSDLNVNYDGNSYVYGDQHCIINFDGVSGSVQIREE